MGNADTESPIKHIPELLLNPVGEIGLMDTQEGKQPVMYEYPWLNSIPDTHLLAKSILTEEMRQFVNTRRTIYEAGTPEFNNFFDEMQNNMRTLLPEGIKTTVGIGTPVIVERYGDNISRKALNIIFALARKREGEKDFALLAHPFEVEGDKIVPALQRRTDNDEFQPPLWYIQNKYPFGYRGIFPHIVSYPFKK